MLINFFYTLKNHELPVSIREFLDLLDMLERGMGFANPDEFYALARTSLIKDEKHFDRFDLAFGHFMQGIEDFDGALDMLIPDDWINNGQLSPEQVAKLKAQGFDNPEELMEALKKRFEEQQKRHQGGNKWIGTGGTSPFGNSGTHLNGVRVGGESRSRSASKVWEKRQFRDLDPTLELGTRNLKVALRKLRVFARTGAADQLDLNDTIRSTARNAGYLDLKMVPEKHNAVKVLLFFDIGGSMDDHIRTCEELFSAATTEFKHLEYFYFHNFIYDFLWKNNQRRGNERHMTQDIINTYGNDYKVIFVGDAAMAPWEISHVGGSIEYYNQESGAVWMQRVIERFPKLIWLNPEQEKHWGYSQSNQMTRQLIGERMYPLTVDGLEAGMAELRR
ncbi:MAG: Thioredoxin reductase (EC [uncultured Thiotrichaceae bacterium]|uniref:Thioredoxin reductase (EC) n=1 Tax=uncultured Thiotrichaceae bacterium TaxID=298394 RepID=A0A6S6TRE7_9GAMM|nr:MAG: Thioredoxin reductase (EC [uncultured Thiotrichaceae bacterium]